jgi:hypothetical protein
MFYPHKTNPGMILLMGWIGMMIPCPHCAQDPLITSNQDPAVNEFTFTVGSRNTLNDHTGIFMQSEWMGEKPAQKQAESTENTTQDLQIHAIQWPDFSWFTAWFS